MEKPSKAIWYASFGVLMIRLRGNSTSSWHMNLPRKSRIASGLTQAEMAKLNQSIEAFVYCILGAQVNVRSSVLDSPGSAKGAQHEFFVSWGWNQKARHLIERSEVSALHWWSKSQAWSWSLFKADKKLGVNKSVNLEMKISRGKATEWGLIKNQQTDLSPSNKINVTSTKDPVRTPPKLYETNHDIIKVGLISGGLVSSFLIHRLFFWKRSTINIMTPILRSHAFWLRKLITDPTVLRES